MKGSTQVLTFSFYSPPSQFPSLCRRHSSSSPPLIRSHTTSADFEETSVDEESPKIPQRKDLPIKIMSMRKVSVSHILSGRLGWGVQVRGIIPFALFCRGLALGGHLRKEQPFLTSDLHGDLHFLSNSTNEIISTLVYKQWKTVFQKTIIVCRCFQFF